MARSRYADFYAQTPGPLQHRDCSTLTVISGGFDTGIMAVCNGSTDSRTRQDVIDDYTNIDGVVLGCTEIPLIVSQNDMSVTCFDTNEILARATFERCQLNSSD